MLLRETQQGVEEEGQDEELFQSIQKLQRAELARFKAQMKAIRDLTF